MNDRHPRNRTCRAASCSIGERRGASTRNDHGIDTEGIRRTQDRPHIVWILDVVEHEHEAGIHLRCAFAQCLDAEGVLHTRIEHQQDAAVFMAHRSERGLRHEHNGSSLPFDLV